MTIGSIGGNTNAGAVSIGNPNMDSYSKSLQKQIADAQKSLQELAQNNEMDPETKMKKRQEIQKQISDLNMQLRQHQMEEHKKAQQEKQQKNQPKKSANEKSEENAAGLSKSSMEAMISADNSVKQAKLQGDTANQMQLGADIKRAEIKRDGGGSKRTSDDSVVISSKWDDVESMEQHAKTATASQISTLAEAQSKLREANAEGSTTAKTQEKNGGKAKTEGVGTAAAEGTETIAAAETAGAAVTAEEPQETEAVSVSAPAKQSEAIGSNIDVKV